MHKKAISILAVFLLAICLISGGCSSSLDNKVDIKDWKDLFSASPEKSSVADKKDAVNNDEDAGLQTGQELIEVDLYFVGPDGNSLVAEKRKITKSESMARNTLEELVKGPANEAYLAAIPVGTTLRDINLKPDGLCIVDLSAEAREAGSEEQEQMMVYAIANTLGQFKSVKDVCFMVEGERVETIAGFVDLSESVKPNYDL